MEDVVRVVTLSDQQSQSAGQVDAAKPAVRFW
jgi:hypothetical protein